MKPNFVEQYKTFVDTCTWMHPNSVEFLTNRLPQALFVKKARLKLPWKVIFEVNKLMKDEKKDTRRRAKRAARLLQMYIDAGLVHVLGEKDDRFTDQQILTVFQSNYTKHNLALITQDSGLAKDAWHFNHQNAVRGKKVLVFRVNEHSELEAWDFDYGPKDQPTAPREEPVVTGFPIGRTPRIATQVLDAAVPQRNETVSSPRFGKLVLHEVLATGEHAVLYRTDQGKTCAIYHRGQMTDVQLDKLRLMLQLPVTKKGICWPQDLVLNEKGEAVGYVMDTVEGVAMDQVFRTKQRLLQQFPNWNRKELATLAITILEKIEHLQQQNVSIRNLSWQNIWIKSEKEVYFVETDGYQLGDFPAHTPAVAFTPPELHGRETEALLCTVEQDAFVVATLLFLMLFPGKLPYSYQGAGSPGENMRPDHFALQLDEPYLYRAPDGPWRNIFAHLPYRLQQALYGTFKKEQRLATADWLLLMRLYKHSIQTAGVCNDLFPTHQDFPPEKMAQVRCQSCKAIYEVHKVQQQRLEQSGQPCLCKPCYEHWGDLGQGAAATATGEASPKPVNQTVDPNGRLSFLEVLADFMKHV